MLTLPARHFTWAWHAVIMGTGVVSALIHLFPYYNGSHALKIVALVFFLLNLVLFVFVCTCTILRYIMFPEVSRSESPSKGLRSDLRSRYGR